MRTRRSNGAWRAGALLLAVAAAPAAAADTYECLIEPHVDVSVSSVVPGVIEAIEVARGSAVERGQVLVRLRAGVERAAVELARARAEFGARKVERNVDLVADELISANEQDEIETEALLARLELREAEERLRQRTIHSPVDGVVADVRGAPGEYVSDGEILRVAQIDPLNVEVVVPVAAHGRIEEGLAATVTPEPPFDRELTGRVVIVDHVVDAASGTFGVRIDLPNPDHGLPAGLQCEVELPGPGG